MTYLSFPGLRQSEKEKYLGVKGYAVGIAKRRFERVIAAVEVVTKIKRNEICSIKKGGLLPTLRAIIAEYVYRRDSLVTQQEVADLLGLSDHTSIYYMIKRSIPIIKFNSDTKKIYDDIHRYL